MRKGIEAPNYTAVPNRLFEIFPLMKETELRVTLTIARETFGWRRDRKRLSLSLLMELTGLSRQGVLMGTDFGMKRGTIERFEVKDYRNRKTFEYELIVLADDATCEGADRSKSLTGQNFRPVKTVDHKRLQPVKILDPLKEKTLKKKRGGVSDLESDPRKGGQPSTPVIEPSSAAHSSSKTPAASTPTPEDRPLAITVGAALASLANVPRTVVLSSPDGVAAGAAGAGLQDSQEVQAQPQVGANEQATSSENVPAAEGSCGAENGAGRVGVDALRPVDAQVLAARPVMSLEGPAYKALRSLVGKSLPEMLKEKTRTGQLPRGELWLRLELGEIELARVTAQAESQALKTSMITLAVKGLDRLIGAVKAPKASSTPAATVPREVQVTGPQDLSHLDPQLMPGQRCTVDGQLGVVTLKLKPEYTVLLDDGEHVLVDRHVAAQLQGLRLSDAPHPEALAAAPQPSVPVQVPVGTVWRPKAGGDVVRVTAAKGTNRILSNGATVAFYTLMTNFEQMQA